MVLSDTSKQLNWIKNLLLELKISFVLLVLFEDNIGSQFWTENPVTEKCSKYMDTQYHLIRKYIQEERIVLDFIEESKNPADLFTKNLGPILFNKFLSSYGLQFSTASSKEEY